MESKGLYSMCQNNSQFKEAFAIIHTLKKSRPYLSGADFQIIVDHKPLKIIFLSEI